MQEYNGITLDGRPMHMYLAESPKRGVSRGGRGSRSNSGKKDSESVPSVKDLDMDIDNYMKEGSEKAR